MNELELKREFLLKLNFLRQEIPNFKFVHVLYNDKFCKSIVEFISDNFNRDKHCFIFTGGLPESEMPLPDRPNVYNFPSCLCLNNSDRIDKFIFHGLYMPNIDKFLFKNRDILAKSYWLPWGHDIYETDRDSAEMTYIKGNMAGVAANNRVKRIYLNKFGNTEKLPQFFPYNITYESIPYQTIVSTKIPQKDYYQILVNNSAHKSTLEALELMKKFKNENIKIYTILSYGDMRWNNQILKKGKDLFGENFIPLTKFIPPDQYIKFLARNDAFILNQGRPQGMTTFFAMMLMGKKVFMRSELSDYLKMEGYNVGDTQAIPEMTLTELLEPVGKERNRELAAQRFDPTHVRNFWQTIFDYKPAKNISN